MREGLRKTIVLGLVPLVLYALMLTVSPLMEPDEGRYSAIPLAMNQTGDYVTPRLMAAVYFEKPPLSYWATALAFKLFGENEFASRIFVGLCAWGMILLVYRMGIYFHDRQTGLYGAAVLTTFLFHAAIGRINILDMPLALFVCLAIWSGFRYLDDLHKPKRQIYLLYCFSALAFLAKGLIGIVFPFGVLVIWLVVSRRWRDLPTLVSPIGIILFCAVALPWLILVQKANPDFFRFFFIQEHFLRYATRMHSRYQPVYFYLPMIIAGTLPWCAFLPEAMRGFFKNRTALFSDTEKKLFLVWIGLILIFFSISSSKLIPYIAPIFPPIALWMGHIFRRYEEGFSQSAVPPHLRPIDRIPVVLQSLIFMAVLLGPPFLKDSPIHMASWWPWIAVPFVLQGLMPWLPRTIRQRTGKGWFLTIYLVFALFLATVIFPVSHYISPYKSAYALSRAINQHLPQGETLYQYQMRLYGIEFYTGLRTPLVDDIGEVSYGSQHLPADERERYFLNSAGFFELVRQREHLYCVSEGGGKLASLRKEIPGITILWHNNEYYLLKLQNPQKESHRE
jgi:4-amino-4-deoxy-L-arabinose transferase-like glycosyltransferase